MEQELQDKPKRGRPPRVGAKPYSFRLPIDLVDQALEWGAARRKGMAVSNSAIIEALIRRGLGR